MTSRHSTALLCLALTLAPAAAAAEVIPVGPSDDFTEIERARAGDEVVIAPGTYRFRVFLSADGTASAPIRIRAQDPTNPPVWDLSGMRAEDFPGSSTRGDRGRGCWQVTGDYYEISGLVIRGCTTSSGNAAGMRTIDTRNVTVRDVLFESNEVGFSGNGEDTLVEFCEFSDNGVRSSPPQHSTYIYGGSFTLRHSYLHDSAGGQNLHIRARRSVIEYNWIARASNYEADMMTGPDDAHEMIFRGNVLITNPSPENSGQVFVLYNDAGRSGVSMNLRVVWNTIIVQGSRNPSLVNVRNDTLDSASIEISNNVILGTTDLIGIRDSGRSNWTLTGGSNYLMTGTDEMSLTGNQLGDAPGFVDAAGADYRPASGSALIGAADPSVTGAPSREYAEDETITRRFRPRLTAADVGAFESDTMGGSFGAYDDPALPPTDAGPPSRDAGAPRDGGAASADAGGGPTDGGPATPTDGSVAADAGGEGGDGGGCGCRAGRGRGEGAGALGLLMLGALWVARRRN